eukprot:CAMPEP_0185850196 /NCGR_PEP_ID=MMETSP1354-20130828/4405_1 /TAXON_ID=708628 /ORGANISM="Erythrolobus madagascarensis, Strain CCMP3276" /LENGTH=662 /DNA_ID=CAMNT_0028550845 /DNA_START=49 /DNA_END=2037 /DNA_ORIENTATION=+
MSARDERDVVAMKLEAGEHQHSSPTEAEELAKEHAAHMAGGQSTQLLTSEVVLGSELAFRDLRVTVELTKPALFGLVQRPTGETKSILDGVSGVFHPGELVYIMGPSGSGKSSLLDTLANRMGLEVNGNIYLDQQKCTAELIKHYAKYVEQEDHLYEFTTTREALGFAHDLFRGFGKDTRASRESRIDRVLAALGLAEQADVRTGGFLLKGLSGGQKRRLSVGEALLGMPRLLFLDEPTSGLDAAAALYLTRVLKRLAHSTGITVVCSIHQPSEQIFEFSDSLMLLSTGQTAYFGPTSEVKAHMQSLGFEKPDDVSLGEWLLHSVNSDFEDAVESKKKVLKGWPGSAANAELMKTLDAIEHAAASSSGVGVADDEGKKIGAMGCNWFQQVGVLSKRGFLNVLRDPTVVWLRLFMYVALGLVIGTVWLQQSRYARDVNDWISVMAFTSGFYIFMSIAVIPAQYSEKHIVNKERGNNAFKASAFVASRALVDLPFLFILSLVCSSVVYWLVGFQASASKFFFFVLVFFVGFVTAEALVFLVSTIVPFYLLAILVVAFIYGAFMTVMGSMIRLDEIGWYLRWMQYISLQFYIHLGLASNELRGVVFTAVPNHNPPLAQIPGEAVLVVLGIEGWNKWIAIPVLLGMAVVYRFLGGVWMHFMHTGKK